MARLHVEGTAFDASGRHPEQIITIDDKPDYFPNSAIVCQTSVIFPQLAYTDRKIKLSEQICNTRKKLSASCFDNYPAERTFYNFDDLRRYTCISVAVGYDDRMQPNMVTIDTAEAQMKERFQFGTRKTILGGASNRVKQIRDFGAKLINRDSDAIHTEHPTRWSQKLDEKTNTLLMCHANLAALHYFKHVGANLIARRSNLGGSHDFVPLLTATDKPANNDVFGHSVIILPDAAADLFTSPQKMRPEYIKVTNLSKMDGLVNAHILHEYRERGAEAVTDKQIAKIARRLNTRPTHLKL